MDKNDLSLSDLTRIVEAIRKHPVDAVAFDDVTYGQLTNRRFTRLTNAFSKKLENHCHMMAIHFMSYNFCRKHGTIKTAPAVAA